MAKRAGRRATISTKTIKLVVQRSGNRCAFPHCNAELTAPGGPSSAPVVLGELAHICGERPDAARFDRSLSTAARNSYGNLVYLCAPHHTIIDAQPADYPVDRLLAMKARHEAWVATRLERAVADVSFHELELVARRVTRGGAPAASSAFGVLDPATKMALNGITTASEHLIKMGMSRSPVVADFLARMADVEPAFAEALREGFVCEYDLLVRDGTRGDALFASLLDFATQGSSDFERWGAGLAVLTYLFETCDLFEREAAPEMGAPPAAGGGGNTETTYPSRA